MSIASSVTCARPAVAVSTGEGTVRRDVAGEVHGERTEAATKKQPDTPRIVRTPDDPDAAHHCFSRRKSEPPSARELFSRSGEEATRQENLRTACGGTEKPKPSPSTSPSGPSAHEAVRKGAKPKLDLLKFRKNAVKFPVQPPNNP